MRKNGVNSLCFCLWLTETVVFLRSWNFHYKKTITTLTLEAELFPLQANRGQADYEENNGQDN